MEMNIILYLIISFYVTAVDGFLSGHYYHKEKLNSQKYFNNKFPSTNVNNKIYIKKGHVSIFIPKMVTSDSNSLIKKINSIINGSSSSIIVGLIGLLLLLLNRSLAIDGVISDIQSRSDIISLMACSAVLLNLLSESNITARERDSVALVGEYIKIPIISDKLDKKEEKSLDWLIKILLSFSPASSVHIMKDDEFIGIGGVIAKGSIGRVITKKGKILDKAISDQEEVYLPDLQILPGKVEFTYLPLNCQCVLILPIVNGAVIIGANQAKVFKLKDVSKIKSILDIYQSLNRIN